VLTYRSRPRGRSRGDGGQYQCSELCSRAQWRSRWAAARP
jgi:hypothetical protein